MSIRTKLIVVFLFFTVVPMTFLGAFVFYSTRSVLKSVRLSQLENIADLKQDKIETFFQERNADLIAAQNFYNIKKNLPYLETGSGGDDYKEAVEQLDNQIRPFQKASGYLNIMLTNRVGKVVYVSDAGHRSDYGQFPLGSDDYEQGKGGIYFTDVRLHKAGVSRLEMFGIAPLWDFKGNFIGEVVFEINMEPVYAFIQNTTGLGKTGEAFITRHEGNKIVYLSPLTHNVMSRPKRDFPTEMAASGKSGSGICLDYSGAEVLAAWRYMPSLRWGLVTKISVSEAYAPVFYVRNIALIVGLVITCLGVIAGLSMAKSISEPIFRLKRGAEIIGRGNLAYRIKAESSDEVGQLSRAFDRMSEALEAKTLELSENASELQRMNEQLKAANRDLESFSYSASHDLRSPLIRIEGFSRILEEDYGERLGEEGMKVLGVVRENTLKMAQLIEDILSFSRVSSSNLSKAPIDMEALASTSAEAVDLGDAKLNINTLPQARGDLSMIRQVFINLVSNAAKYSLPGGDTVIEIGGVEAGEENIYYVKDNGIGFDMKLSKELFGLFQRLHNKREYKGTGVGLAIVKRIVEKHGGRVWAEAVVNKGATFFFSLPR